MHQSPRTFIDRTEIAGLAVVQAIVAERRRFAAQGIGGLFEDQSEPDRLSVLAGAVFDQHDARAGAGQRRAAEGHCAEVEHRDQDAAMGEHPGDPFRRLRNALQAQQRQHFDHFAGIQGIAVAFHAEQQEQLAGASMIAGGAGHGHSLRL